MKFRFGARFGSGDIVVERAWPMRDNHGNMFGKTPRLSVKVHNHYFDSESDGAKRMYRDYVEQYRQAHPEDDTLCEDDIQNRVEQFLLAHPQVGMRGGRGIFPMTENETPSTSVAPSQVSRCIHTVSNDDGTTDQCENSPAEGDIVCAEHAQQTVEVG